MFYVPVCVDNFGQRAVAIPRGTILSSGQEVEPEVFQCEKDVERVRKRGKVSVKNRYRITPVLRMQIREKLAHLPEAEQNLLYPVLEECTWLFEERQYLPASDLVQH